MSPMPDFNPRPQGAAEELIHEVFKGRVAGADPQIARLRLARKLNESARSGAALRPSLRFALHLMAGLFALLVFGGWASSLTLKPWDDAQQVTLALPEGWDPAEYPHVTGLMRKYSEPLYRMGAHSLIVDYKRGRDGAYYLQLGILGVNYQQANDWTRIVLGSEPELATHGYSITQPLVPYAVTVGDMLAFRLTGDNTAVEANVVAAWQSKVDSGVASQAGSPRSHGRTADTARVYLITRDTDYARRISMIDY